MKICNHYSIIHKEFLFPAAGILLLQYFSPHFQKNSIWIGIILRQPQILLGTTCPDADTFSTSELLWSAFWELTKWHYHHMFSDLLKWNINKSKNAEHKNHLSFLMEMSVKQNPASGRKKMEPYLGQEADFQQVIPGWRFSTWESQETVAHRKMISTYTAMKYLVQNSDRTRTTSEYRVIAGFLPGGPWSGILLDGKTVISEWSKKIPPI
jgi:hypothetical protein